VPPTGRVIDAYLPSPMQPDLLGLQVWLQARGRILAKIGRQVPPFRRQPKVLADNRRQLIIAAP
jgi:hypothetical protein